MPTVIVSVPRENQGLDQCPHEMTRPAKVPPHCDILNEKTDSGLSGEKGNMDDEVSKVG